jgi:hypothetical protein
VRLQHRQALRLRNRFEGPPRFVITYEAAYEAALKGRGFSRAAKFLKNQRAFRRRIFAQPKNQQNSPPTRFTPGITLQIPFEKNASCDAPPAWQYTLSRLQHSIR